ncbi:hypothetical protein L486_06699 [Kwoniella mangroviensis CBS 10435]|uniref:Uncharacterized protein n=1 Tax=Kwoniella mangroviensis CBS 10435 TaxID=1331196 RepID=A0A1B9IK71_9TREE|nr:uncharacterized protein I203_05398 [Kwoniella mangroviensis CBS 8507]OCF55942.1 hypothetical protein L486_06699 [Kwoniella mangroviensis CBS 10435]OCF65717.1 hypothetical protein I203_05398 [Kwoniella mangroviensis CBS 8507]OCF71561.1 hypothetical protein I204_07619 [Kwoniella mangroviensis CBS 8886]
MCPRMIPSWTREAIKNKYATAMDQVDEYDIEATDELVKQAKDEINTLLAEYMRNNGEVITARTYAIQAGQAWYPSIGREDQMISTDEELWQYADTAREPSFQ